MFNMTRLINKFLALQLICIYSTGVSGNNESNFDYLDPSQNSITSDYLNGLFDISQMIGKWYVLGVAKLTDSHFQPKCWKIVISEKSGLLNGISEFIENTTDEWFTASFNASSIRRYRHYISFRISLIHNEINEDLTVLYFPLKSDDYVVLTVYDHTNQKYSGRNVIISRQPKLVGVNLGAPVNLVDNTNCPPSLDDVEIQ